MWWPPLITVLVDNNRARLQGMEVERGGEERAEINYCLYLTVTGSAIISPLLCPYSLSLSLSLTVHVSTSSSGSFSPCAMHYWCCTIL